MIEDDEKIGSFVTRGLQQEGHHVDWIKNGNDALSQARAGEHDVLIVDLMLPGRDGIDVIRRLRADQFSAPILVLSARSSVDDRVAGLQIGADDYLTKPFSFAELAARVQALARRTRGPNTASATHLEFADLTLDLLTRRAMRGGRTIDLHAKEFALLEYLMRNPERVLSKTMILNRVWEYAFDPQTNVVDVLVSRLRTKIDRGFDAKLIHTIRGVGYVLRSG
ncbi:MAG TPA: response regulator transcription factor [Polyangiaceae bacterium]